MLLLKADLFAASGRLIDAVADRFGDGISDHQPQRWPLFWVFSQPISGLK